jgi:hypothetical protein
MLLGFLLVGITFKINVPTLIASEWSCAGHELVEKLDDRFTGLDTNVVHILVLAKYQG